LIIFWCVERGGGKEEKHHNQKPVEFDWQKEEGDRDELGRRRRDWLLQLQNIHTIPETF
jgi:hypothetical protein